MMKKTLLSLLAASLLWVSGLQAQDLPPRMDCHIEAEQTSDRIALDKIQKETQERLKAGLSRQTAAVSKYRIPVVFHVYGTDYKKRPDGPSNSIVTKELIQAALTSLNEDFNGLNDDFDNIDPLFNSVKETLSISFELAQYDENGNSTDGIVWYNSRGGYKNIDQATQNRISADSWDNYKYMNVYIQNDLSNDGVYNNSGVAWYPNKAMSDAGTARVVYNGAYLGTNTDKEFASVLTHEFGHWLDLKHTFDGTNYNDYGGDGITCADNPYNATSNTTGYWDGDDGVIDTPYTGSALGCRGVLNCYGEYINGENYMDYNVTCYKMFTHGQVARMLNALNHSTRKPLWSEENIALTLEKGPKIVFKQQEIKENAYINDGSFAGVIDVELKDMTFVNSSGNLVEGTDFTIQDLPEGISIKIAIQSNTTATLSLEGKANAHNYVNNSNALITFSDNMLTGYSLTEEVFGLEQKIDLKFMDPYTIIHSTIIVNGSSNITSSTVDNDKRAFKKWFFTVDMDYGPITTYRQGHGVWYNNATSRFELESYGNEVIANADKNVTLLAKGIMVDDTQNWVVGGNSANLHHIYTTDFQDWKGNEGYAGCKFSIDGNPHYGWVKFNMAADGNSLKIVEYAYYTKPDAGILTGQTELVALTAQTIDFEPIASPLNVGDDKVALSATATSGLTVTFTSSDEAVLKVVNGNELEIVGVGTAIITASQAGNDEYDVAVAITQTVVVESSSVLGTNKLLGLKLYPNPNEGVFTVEALENITDIKVFTLQGVQIKIAIKGNDRNQSVDLSGTSAGMYQVVITTKKGVSTKKILIK